MNPKKLFQAIKDCNRTRQERMYRLLVTIGLFGLLTAIILGILFGESLINNLAIILVFFVILGIVIFSILRDKVQLGAVTIATIIIFVVLPFNFLTTGGIYGGGPIWFMFGVVFVCLVVENGTKYFFFVSSLIICACCYYVAYFHPELMISHTISVAYVDSFASLAVVTIMTCSMILFQNAIFRSENEITQKQKKEIEELNQMQNRFFSSMSHEIRTPINTIIGLNEMILREDVSDEVAADAKSIQGASKMLLTLINDILDMSKIESGNMDIVPVSYDVGEMLSDIVNMIWVRAKEKGLEFHINVDQSMPSKLLGDEIRIKQILINVLNNAVKYTAEGSVTLDIQCINQKNGHAQIIYSVTDTGMGIKKENLPYLFSAFKRVEEEKNRYIEGTGLGLSIVKQLVDLMHGEIEVNSVYTKGSTFVIIIPQKIVGEDSIGALNLEDRHELNVRKHYKKSFEAPKARVLIVDDNDTNLMVAEKLLRDTKVKIDTVLGGKKCLRETLKNRYDVIFMDHLMPEMDGIECMHEVRKQVGGLNQNTPIVVLTANAGGENQALYRREGFDGYLLKPVTGAQLESELLRHLPRELVNMMKKSDSVGVVESPILEHREKRMVMISADSVCDLPREMVERHNISIMPYRVVTEGGVFLDGVETETDGVLSYLEERNKRVSSEAPTVADYEEFFAEQLTKSQYIIHITMAKGVGLGYRNAKEASKTFDNVFVVNSGQLSSGMGLLVLRAAELAYDGMTADAIVNEIEKIKLKVKTSFIVNKTEYLARGGRISAKIDSICQAFMIHPVIVLKDNYMKVGAVRIGTRDSAWEKYIASILRSMDKVDKRILFITYAGLSFQELEKIEEQVTSKYSFEQVIIQKASPAISANCGPGSFGLLFMLKE